MSANAKWGWMAWPGCCPELTRCEDCLNEKSARTWQLDIDHYVTPAYGCDDCDELNDTFILEPTVSPCWWKYDVPSVPCGVISLDLVVGISYGRAAFTLNFMGTYGGYGAGGSTIFVDDNPPDCISTVRTGPLPWLLAGIGDPLCQPAPGGTWTVTPLT